MAEVVLPTTTKEWQRDCSIMYANGMKDALDIACLKGMLTSDDAEYLKEYIPKWQDAKEQKND